MEFYAINKQRMQGVVQYLSNEMSFYTLGSAESFYTITLGSSYLGLEIASDCETVCAISGLSSQCLWEFSSIELPTSMDGTLKLLTTDDLVIGCGYKYSENWNVSYDKNSKIALIAKTTYSDFATNGFQYVRFLENAICVLAGSNLVAIYVENLIV